MRHALTGVKSLKCVYMDIYIIKLGTLSHLVVI